MAFHRTVGLVACAIFLAVGRRASLWKGSSPGGGHTRS
ncbi:hypothetical protein MTO96_020520, partial [Rhipicephalus appendiculatus]